MWYSTEIFFALILCGFGATNGNKFPPNFIFGAAVASYQVEGAWNVSDKGESIWDHMVHNRPKSIIDASNGDTAVDSYHKYKEDIQLLKAINGKAYRFSLSWPRILPDGFINRMSADGVRYYNDLINECLSNDIIPMVTIYHWDLPQRLQELGGWTNPLIVEWITDFADVVFALFGDRVKLWITMNEPTSVCFFGYGDGFLAPGLTQSGIADYLCGHYQLLSHASIAELYNRKYRNSQNGKIGLAASVMWSAPSDNESIADIEAAHRAFEFYNGWFLNPLSSPDGDYPKTMKDRILKKSLEQGFKQSRLPEFTRSQIEYLKNCTDFIGLNFYTALSFEDWSYGSMSLMDDAGFKSIPNKHWKGTFFVKDTPKSFDKLLETLNKRYRLPEIYITENGYASTPGLCDEDRIVYLHDNLHALLKAIKNGVNVLGYITWSLIDNFEWYNGYTKRFGLFDVDFNDPNKPRTAKLSASYMSEIYRTGSIPDVSKFTCEGR